MIHTNRSRGAFEKLIGACRGILVGDYCVVYQKWVNKRQSCLAHLIRKARAPALRPDPELSSFGKWAAKELVRLLRMVKHPPTVENGGRFLRRFASVSPYIGTAGAK